MKKFFLSILVAMIMTEAGIQVLEFDYIDPNATDCNTTALVRPKLCQL